MPKTFFKYYALNDYSVDALTNMYIYASHPNQFNDPFDCNEKLVEFNTWDDVKNLWEPLFEKNKKDYLSLEDACTHCSYVYKTLLYRKLGLFSLAPRHDNYIMWSLYSQNNGFCVEFDIDQFPFNHYGPFPINYVDNIPSPVHVGQSGGEVAMLIQTNIKNKRWEHEQEWRLYIPNPLGVDIQSFGPEAGAFNIFNEHNRKFRYPISAIKSIFLGTSFFDGDNIDVNVISNTEAEVVFKSNDSLTLKVLDFISRIQLMFDLKVYHSNVEDFSECEFIPIVIARISEIRYRIIHACKINK